MLHHVAQCISDVLDVWILPFHFNLGTVAEQMDYIVSNVILGEEFCHFFRSILLDITPIHHLVVLLTVVSVIEASHEVVLMSSNPFCRLAEINRLVAGSYCIFCSGIRHDVDAGGSRRNRC